MLKKIKITLIFSILALLLTGQTSCNPFANSGSVGPSEKITLNYWSVYNEPEYFNEIAAAYKISHPDIDIKFRKLRFSEYENELIDALAEDRGPDMFSIHNTWMKKYQSKIEPMPEATTLTYWFIQGTIKEQLVSEQRTTRTVSPQEIRDNFVDAVQGDVIFEVRDENSGKINEKIYGLPLAVDTLAMYYNKDLLNNAGIAQPSTYWDQEFQQNVKKLTKQDIRGNIIQSGVALGGSDNIERSTDILSILMMQNGTEMMDDSRTNITFTQIPEAFKQTRRSPGLEALRFYTDFANPAKEVYSWNSDLDNSLEMFTQGKLALMFGYSYHLPQIQANAPKLNFSIAPLPQIEGNSKINFANYWVETVSKKSKNADAAWDFIQFAAKAENVKSYLKKSGKPTAVRSLINEQINQNENEYLTVFAKQLLTAKNWYRGNDPLAAEEIIKDMIDAAVAGQGELADIINLASGRIQQTVRD